MRDYGFRANAVHLSPRAARPSLLTLFPLGQVSTEYLLATGLFMVIFVSFYQIVQDSLKNLFRQIAFVILSSYQ
ncbi:MAG: hypothetical protein HY547_07565 [Elusimicrobia bacterium]|nr:hypothetical protein [Elusimicrobiota bacterium]